MLEWLMEEFLRPALTVRSRVALELKFTSLLTPRKN